MDVTIKYYPTNKIKLEKIFSSLQQIDEVEITNNTPLWMTGKILTNDIEIGFLITDEGSFAFVLKVLNSRIIEYIRDLLRRLGFICFVSISIKLHLDNEIENFTLSDLENNYFPFSTWFDVEEYRLRYKDKNKNYVDFVEIQLSDKERCYK